jgi:DNA polymerase-4
MSLIFHLDLDAFFVSVERILDPSLEGKPVIVGADPRGRGVVAACSYEARKYGLHSAMPIRTAYGLCPGGIYIRGHHTKYSEYSEAVGKLLAKYAPVIKQASIDEFTMDFTGCEKIYGPPEQLASLLQKEIWDELHLPASIGVASSKIIAKIASDFRKPKGITVVPLGGEKEFLAPLPVEKIPGVGKSTLERLNRKGIFYVRDIAERPSEYLTANLGKWGLFLWQVANGHASGIIAPHQEQKSISKENTFHNDVGDMEFIEASMFELTGKICQSLRDLKMTATTVSVKLRYSDFHTVQCQRTIHATRDDKTVYEEAVEMFRELYSQKKLVRLIGVKLSNLRSTEQGVLFFEGNYKRESMLDAVGSIRQKYSYDSLSLGASSNFTRE